ncbi:hypothetical protein [Micromonospora sp. HM5-17]|uniref:hypothetical protein n=1 Tax=Micromonospora sp. HM5-17 TaxID=2487710 RepID=UPI0011CE97B5|nr:hypothetical protein [Micromonospora sp. HM5-17]
MTFDRRSRVLVCPRLLADGKINQGPLARINADGRGLTHTRGRHHSGSRSPYTRKEDVVGGLATGRGAIQPSWPSGSRQPFGR